MNAASRRTLDSRRPGSEVGQVADNSAAIRALHWLGLDAQVGCLVCDYCTCCEPIHVLTAIPQSRSAPVKRRVPHGAGAPHALPALPQPQPQPTATRVPGLRMQSSAPSPFGLMPPPTPMQNSAACRQVLPVDRHASATHYFQRGMACLAQPLRLIEQPHGFGLEHASYHISYIIPSPRPSTLTASSSPTFPISACFARVILMSPPPRTAAASLTASTETRPHADCPVKALPPRQTLSCMPCRKRKVKVSPLTASGEPFLFTCP